MGCRASLCCVEDDAGGYKESIASIEGEALDEVINPLIAEDQVARLVSLEESFG
jgi:hypothetical protein